MKETLSILTLIVSLFAAWSAYEAKNAAQSLNERKFESETTISLLSSTYSNLISSEDPRKEAIGCLFIETLRQAEKRDVGREPYLVDKFLTEMEENQLWNPDCQILAEALSSETPAPVEVSAQSVPFSSIGKWHAVIASYQTTDRGCEHAKEDVAEFARLLRGRPELDGLYLYVARTKQSNNYAVTIDTGQDRAKAGQARRLIIEASANSSDRRTGADSFVQGNRSWFIDGECSAVEAL